MIGKQEWMHKASGVCFLMLFTESFPEMYIHLPIVWDGNDSKLCVRSSSFRVKVPQKHTFEVTGAPCKAFLGSDSSGSVAAQ